MKAEVRAATAHVVLLFLLASGAAQAAEIKVLSAAGIRSAVLDVGAQFESATGHKLIAKFVGGPAVRQAIAAGEKYDVAISQPNEIEALLKDGRIVPDSRAEVARSGMGIGVRHGAAKPDVASPDAFKRALLEAKSIAYAGDGASGAFFIGLFERLGVAAEVKPKLKSMPAGTPSAEAVARGEADMVLLSIPSILAVPGVELAGPLPPELQYYSGFAGGLVTGAAELDAGKAFMKFLTSPEAAAAIKKHGLEPSAK